MYVDVFNRLADAQAVTATTFTANNIDLSLARDIGEGTQLTALFSPSPTLAGTGTLNCQMVVSDYPLYILQQTVTISVATPGVVTLSSGTHAMQTGSPIQLATTGALPTGLAVATTYYVINTGSTTTFRLATNLANALAGTAIATSGTQSGTHSASQVAYIYVGDSGAIGLAEVAVSNAVPQIPLAVEINPRIARYGARYLCGILSIGSPSNVAGTWNVDVVHNIQDGRKFHASGFTVV